MTSIATSISNLNPNVEMHLRAAMAALRLGDIEVAVSEADKARSIDQSPQVLIVFAALAHSMGRDIDALTMLDHAAKLAPSIGNYPDASAAILLKLGQKSDGIFNLKLGTHLPQDSFVAEIIGDFFGNIKAIFDSFIDNRPLRTAELMMTQNMYMSAFHQLETYISVSGGDSLSFSLISECALRLGRQVDARVALSALRALDANYPALADMELQLAILIGDAPEIRAKYAVLQPPSSLNQAIERMSVMVASPNFGDVEIDAAKKEIFDFINPVDGLSDLSFSLEKEKIVIGFFCESIDASLENIISALKEYAHIKIYILGRVVPPSQQRLKAAIEDWREVASVDDLTLAEMIRMDGVSILFDCSALGKFWRPSIFRSRVAPLQILWQRDDGYDDDKSYDYYLEFSLAQDANQKSRAVRLSNPLAYPIPPLEGMGKILDLRAKRVLLKQEPSDHVRLLAPHTSLVVSDDLLQCWTDILLEAPASILTIIAPSDINDPYVQRIISIANQKSVSERIELIGEGEFKESLYDILLEADIVLDSFPRGSKEAVREALLIGCPVLTLSGDKPYDSASSLLAQSGGLGDYIAINEADYKARAVTLASSAEARSAFSKSLEKMHKDVTLLSYQSTALELSKKLDALWQNWYILNS